MEKLILKSVMYGVDKVPDSWFDKVPGGFYKAKADAKAQESQKKTDGGDGGKKQRRYSHHSDDRRRARRDRYEDEYRSDDNRRQDRRGRSSYDGNHDDNVTGNGQRGVRETDRRQRRHSVDSDTPRYSGDFPRAADNVYHSDRKYQPGRQPRPADPYFDETQRPITGDSSRSANAFSPKGAVGMGTGFAAAAAAESGAPYPQTRPGSTVIANMPSPQFNPAQAPPSDRSRSGSVNNTYVPYAHIYGRPDEQPAQPKFAPPPTFPPGPSAPRSTAHPSTATNAARYGYQQNPFAQEAPTAADAGAGPQYTGQPIYAPQPTAPMSARAFTGYENKPPYPETPRVSRTAERYSPPYASQPKRDSDSRRARSERRSDDPEKGGRYQARDAFVDPRTPLTGQKNEPPPPPGPPPAEKNSRRDSAYYGDRPRSSRHNDRGYTSD